MTALEAFLHKIVATENMSGYRPREITLHPLDFAELKDQCARLSFSTSAEPSLRIAGMRIDGVSIKTDPSQTRLPRSA